MDDQQLTKESRGMHHRRSLYKNSHLMANKISNCRSHAAVKEDFSFYQITALLQKYEVFVCVSHSIEQHKFYRNVKECLKIIY